MKEFSHGVTRARQRAARQGGRVIPWTGGQREWDTPDRNTWATGSAVAPRRAARIITHHKSSSRGKSPQARAARRPTVGHRITRCFLRWLPRLRPQAWPAGIITGPVDRVKSASMGSEREQWVAHLGWADSPGEGAVPEGQCPEPREAPVPGALPRPCCSRPSGSWPRTTRGDGEPSSRRFQTSGRMVALSRKGAKKSES